MNDLRRKGIKFEEYDMPDIGLKTTNGIASMRADGHEDKTAWFKDTEGNILALHERVKVGEEVRQTEVVGSGARFYSAGLWEDADATC